MAVSGVSFLIKVNTGTAATPVWTSVAGQRDGTLNLNTGSFDSTNKDSLAWHEELAGIREWDLSFDALLSETDTGMQELEDAFMNNVQVGVQLSTAASNTYTGDATLTSFSLNMPYNDVATASGSLKGTGALVKAS